MEDKVFKRKGEEYESPYRSGRFYSVKNEWYFSVRESDDQGPFISKVSAEESLKNYLMDFEYFRNDKMEFNINNLKLI